MSDIFLYIYWFIISFSKSKRKGSHLSCSPLCLEPWKRYPAYSRCSVNLNESMNEPRHKVDPSPLPHQQSFLFYHIQLSFHTKERKKILVICIFFLKDKYVLTANGIFWWEAWGDQRGLTEFQPGIMQVDTLVKGVLNLDKCVTPNWPFRYLD